MDLSVLSSLSAEERAALKAALDEPICDPVEKLTGIVKMQASEIAGLKEELSNLKEELSNLKALVMDDLIGGIKEAYDGTVRTERMGEFKGKFGSMLDPLAEPFKRTFNADLHEKAFDYADELRAEEGFTEDNLGEKLQEVVDQIKERLGIKEEQSPVIAEVAAEAEKPAEEGNAEEEPYEEDAQKAWDEISSMKRRDDKRDARFENRQARKRGA